MWSWSTPVTGTSRPSPTASGTRCGTRASSSTTRSGSPQEVLTAAADDVRVALGLLDARMVWGEPRVAEPLLEKAKAAWRDKLGTKYLPLLEDQMGARRAAAGDVAFLLEPDLKESHGGLRDVSVLRAIAAYAAELPDYADLGSVEPATRLLTDVRVELHRMAGREHDKLLLQDQDQVAAALELPDADDLMAAVSNAGRQIAWVCDDVWRRRRLWDPTPTPKRRLLQRRSGPDGSSPGAIPPQDLGPDLTDVDGELALTPEAPVSSDTSLPLRLAATAARLDRPIAKGSLFRLADRMPAPGDHWTEETRHALVDLLAMGPPAVDKIESLDQHGLFVRLLPEWSAVRNKPQRNAYHRFTVDRHLLETAALAAGLTDAVERPDLLLVGALLHDIGKGIPGRPHHGRHRGGGPHHVAAWASRAADVDVLVDMVRHHLLLPDTATRRTSTTPRRSPTSPGPAATASPCTCWPRSPRPTAGRPVRAPGGHGRRGWSPIWSSERTNTSKVTRALPSLPTPSRPPTESSSTRFARPRAAVSPLRPPQVIVAAPDRRGLLSSVAGALALNGMDVRAANVAGEAGVAVEIFTVEVARGTWPDTAKLREDLTAVLADPVVLDERLSEREQLYAQRRRSAAHLPGSDVEVDNGASETATVLELRAPDEIGLLHRITRALFETDLDVVSARVSTLGEMVVDAFYVRKSDGGKITDPERLSAVTAALRREFLFSPLLFSPCL